MQRSRIFSRTLKYMEKGMTTRNFLFLIGSLFVGLSLVAFFGFNRDTEHQAIQLRPPSFVGVAHAEAGLAQDTTAPFLEEAGIAAYIQAPGGITINNDVKNLYRTIEAEEDTYIIGSMAVTDYDDSQDVHVYMDTDGWVMAYYFKDVPTSKIIDWRHWEGGSTLPTKLKRVIDDAAPVIGIPTQDVTYYHFNYPNATHMTLIAELVPGGETDSFTIKLPTSFSYYEYSWWMGTNKVIVYYLNEEEIAEVDNTEIYSTFTAGQLPGDQQHTINFQTHHGDGYGGLALIYQE